MMKYDSFVAIVVILIGIGIFCELVFLVTNNKLFFDITVRLMLWLSIFYLGAVFSHYYL